MRRTRPEQTGFVETSRYDDVVGFLDDVAAQSDLLHVNSFGYTHEGRKLPLVVFGRLANADAASIRATGRTRVLIVANIHAGEVCGKEAMLQLMRELATGRYEMWSDSLVLVIAPIYNADGNERIRLTNRGRQLGPVGGMGVRANAQNYDLNRDFTKVDAPETRSLLRILNEIDPHLVMDLHTTNGTQHGYHLTYAPPLHPNTPASIDTLLRQVLLPTVGKRVAEATGWRSYHYGNLPPRSVDLERGWYTFDHRPRFGTNYVGLRNRAAILSEAYAYSPFEERIGVTYAFTLETIRFVYEHASRIARIVEDADALQPVGEKLALRAQHKRSEQPVDIILGEVTEERNPYSGALMLRRKDETRTEQMTAFISFEGTEWEELPEAYYVPEAAADVLDRLAAHGIRMDALSADTTLGVEQFRVDSTQTAERVFQGRAARTLFGRYESRELLLSAGTVRVPTRQPLGRLAFSLLEPRSDDGFVAWGLAGAELDAGDAYAIVRATAR